MSPNIQVPYRFCGRHGCSQKIHKIYNKETADCWRVVILRRQPQTDVHRKHGKPQMELSKTLKPVTTAEERK
ncbi:MAG: hypothetical protein QXT10_06580 [Candidatus Bathyarchaeia archaeon]